MAATAIGLPEAGAAGARNRSKASMADARASRKLTVAAGAGNSRAAAPTEQPTVAHARANAADVADAPADAIIVGRPAEAAESVASSGARLMRLHDLFAGQTKCSVAIAGGCAESPTGAPISRSEATISKGCRTGATATRPGGRAPGAGGGPTAAIHSGPGVKIGEG